MLLYYPWEEFKLLVLKKYSKQEYLMLQLLAIISMIHDKHAKDDNTLISILRSQFWHYVQ